MMVVTDQGNMTMRIYILPIGILAGCPEPDELKDSIDTGSYAPTRCPGDVSDNVAAGGESIYVAGTMELTATFHGGDAGYSSILRLSDPDEVFIGQLHNTAQGATVNLGTFSKGQELIFSLEVPSTGDVWYSGDASRNTDGFAHARIVQAQTGLWYGGFEDMAQVGDSDFNDVCFSLNGELSTTIPDQ